MATWRCRFIVGTFLGILLLAIGSAGAPTEGALRVTLSEDVHGFCFASVWNEVVFRANVSGGVSPYRYSRSFGDGSPESTVPAPTHSYADAGQYTANVTITDELGSVATASSTFYVVPPPCPVRSVFPILGFAAFLSGVAIGILAIVLVLRRRAREPWR